MRTFKRILSLVLSVAMVLSVVLIPGIGVVQVSAAPAQSGSGQTIHPFNGSEALVRDTVEELAALGKTAKEKERDDALAAEVERSSGMSYEAARSAVYGALTANYGASRIDVSALGLSEDVMSALVESVLADNYLSGAFTNLRYTTKDGKVTRVSYTVSEGYASAMAAAEAEMPVELSDELTEAPSDVLEGSYEPPVLFDDGEGGEEESSCTNHTVSGKVIGDYDEDGEIDIADMAIFRMNVIKDPDSCRDYNGDGEINVADMAKFRQKVLSGDLDYGPPEIDFVWNEEPTKDTSYAFDEDGNQLTDEKGNPVGAGLLYNTETKEVEQGIVPNVYFELQSAAFDCSVCGAHIEITNETEEGRAALAQMISAKDVWINVVTYEQTVVDAGTDPGFSEEEKDNWLLYTEIELASYTDDTFVYDPATGPKTDEEGNIIGLFTSDKENGQAEVAYFYSILSSFINDKAEYFGTPTDFWTSKNSESNPMAALKYICNVDPETQVPPAQMTMMVRDLPQAFMAYYLQYGSELLAMRDAAMKAMPSGLTEVQTQLFLHDWLAENAWFDMGAMTAKDEDGNPANTDPIQMTTFGALLSNQLRDSYDSNHDGKADGYYGALCPGYAAAYNLLVQAAHPEVYQVTEKDADGKDSTRWATVAEVDANGGDLVDFVQVKFLVDTADASLAGAGFDGGIFNNVHYFSAVKADNPSGEANWYYVDACYDDIYIECMQQYRGESDGSVNHTYFMVSPQTMAKLYGDNVERIDSLYDGYVYNETDEVYEKDDPKYNPDDPNHHKYEKVENPDETAYDDTSYEDSWFSGAISKIYWGDDSYVYYVDGGASAASYADMMDQMESEDSDMDVSMSDMTHGTRVNVESQDLLKKRPISAPDYLEESEDSSGFGVSTKEDPDAIVLFDYGTGAMNGEVVLGDEVIEDFVFTEQYPALAHTVALYGGKLYFNLSNDIYVCGTDGSNVKLFKEYNDVKATSDGRLFTATSFTLDANGKDLSVSNHPINAIAVHTTYTPQYTQKDYGGQKVNVFTGMATAETMTVNIATNYSFTSSGADAADEDRYTVEAVNFNPDYQLYSSEEVENDNEEFMWCAVIRDELDIASLAGATSGGSKVSVPATCTRPAYEDTRNNGVITNRTAVEGSEPAGHHYVYDSTEGVYLCETCKLHANVKVEDTENGVVTLYAMSSNGLDGVVVEGEDAGEYEGMELGEEITPVSTVREAETKATGEIEIQCEPDADYRVAKVEYKYEGSTATGENVSEDGYTELEPTEVVPEEGEETDEAAEPETKYLLNKEEGCVSIRVTFEKFHTVTVENPDEGGTVILDGVEPKSETEPDVYEVTVGETVTLKVEAEDGYAIEAPEVTYVPAPAEDGESTAAADPVAIELTESEEEEGVYTFEMPDGAVTVVPVFVKESTVTIAENANCTVTAAVGETEVKSGETPVKAGETVTLTVVPAEGFTAEAPVVATADKEIEVAAVEGKEGVYTFEMPEAPVTVTVATAEKTYAITVAESENGTATADKKEAVKGEIVTLTITPAENYEIDKITVTDAAGTEIEVKDNAFTMPASDVTVTVTFKAEEKSYAVKVEAGTNGTASADKQTAKEGDTVTLTITANDGYEVDTVKAGDVEVKPVDGVYSFPMPAADVTVTVTFKETEKQTHKVTVNVNAGTMGSASATPTSAKEGETVTLTVQAYDGYEVESVKIGDKALTGNEGVYSFTMPDADVTVDVTFRAVSTETPEA